MTNDNTLAYEDNLLQKEGLIRVSYIVDIVILAGAVIAYGVLRYTQVPLISNIMLPLVLGGILYAMLNRSRLKHIATIKRYREIGKQQPQPSPPPYSSPAAGSESGEA